MRKINDYTTLVVKGVAMGMADVVPGVSGGTIAFISGIYEELVNSIKNIDLTALRLLFSLKLGQFWKKINGSFLISVVGGICISIFSLAKLMTWLLENQPIGTWSFFFGLIIASAVFVSGEISKWSVPTVVSLILGVIAAYAVTVITPASTPDTWWFVIFSGAIAICAMILPGISGAFVLLLLGKYAYIMDAVSNFRIGVILLFVIGAAAGITSFSHILSWLLKKYRDVTIAVLTGFMVGSLNKVWPWKQVLETYTDRHGVVHPLIETNITPAQYSGINGISSELGTAVALCVAGFLLIFIIEAVAAGIKKNSKPANLKEPLS